MTHIIDQYLSILYQKAKSTKQVVYADFTDGRLYARVKLELNNIHVEYEYPKGRPLIEKHYELITQFLKEFEVYELIPVINNEYNSEILNSIPAMKIVNSVQNKIDTEKSFALIYLDDRGENLFTHLATDGKNETKIYRTYKEHSTKTTITTSTKIMQGLYNGKCELKKEY